MWPPVTEHAVDQALADLLRQLRELVPRRAP